MAIQHVFSNAVADVTGTVSVWNGSTTETRAATELVRPSDWNSVHNQYYTLSGNTAGVSAVSGTNVVWQAGNNITLSGTGSSIIVSGASQSVQTQGSVAILGSTGNISLANSNGITVGGNASTITFSHNGITSQSIQTQNSVQVLGSSGNISFGNANGITFGGNASTITASHNGLTSQSNQAYSAGNGSAAFQTLSFADSNGVSFSSGTQGLFATVKTDYLTTQSAQAFSASGGSSAFQTLNFANSNGVTFSNSNGSLIASHNGLTSQSNQAFSASGGSSAFQTLSFNNANGFTFSNVGGAIQGSYTVPSVPAQTNQTLGIYAVGNTTQSSSGTIDARSMSFNGAGNVSVGITGNSVIISGGTASPSPIIVSAGTSSASISSLQFADANGVSFGLNGSTITASVNAGGAGAAMSRYVWPDHQMTALSVPVNSSASFQLLQVPANLSMTRAEIYVSITGGTGANAVSNALLFTAFGGLYSVNGGTLSLVASGSQTYNNTWTSNAVNSAHGLCLVSVPLATNITPGQYYYMANLISSTTGGATAAFSNLYGASQIQTANAFHELGAASGASYGYGGPLGIYSATLTNAPSSVAISGMVATGTGAIRANIAVQLRA